MPVSASLAAAETPRFAVIGLGYVGLPLAVAFGRHWPTLGFDIDADRIAELRDGQDHTLEVEADELASARQLQYGSDPALLDACNVYIVTVPTPIDADRKPDLSIIKAASKAEQAFNFLRQLARPAAAPVPSSDGAEWHEPQAIAA